MLSDQERRLLITQADALQQNLTQSRIHRAVVEHMTATVSLLAEERNELQVTARAGGGDLRIKEPNSYYSAALLNLNDCENATIRSALTTLNLQLVREVREFVVRRAGELHAEHLAKHDKLLCDALHIPHKDDDRALRGVKIREGGTHD